MRIIKEGKIKYENAVKFECKHCGCEFESLEDEYWLDNSISLTSYPSQFYVYSNCPTCHKICRSYKTDHVEQYKVTLTNCDGDPITNKHIKKSINVFGSSL